MRGLGEHLLPVAGGLVLVALMGGPAIAVTIGFAAGGTLALWSAWRRRRSLQRLVEWIEQAGEGERVGRPEGLDGDLDRQLVGPILGLVRRLRRERRRGRSARRFLEQLIDTFPDPVLLADARHDIVRCNGAARAQLGIDRLPQPFEAVIRDPALMRALDAAIGRGRETQVDFTPPADPRRRFAARVAPVEIAEAGRGAVLVLREVSEQVLIERMRSDFVANASHEIRTPLTALVGIVETLRGPARDDPEAREEFLALMSEEATRMQRLIDDLLSLSRIELAETEPPSDRVELAPILRSVAADLAAKAERTGVELRLEIDPGLGVIPADADQLYQLTVNLLDNAIKYGASGKRVELRAERIPVAPPEAGSVRGRPAVRICVRDHGPGIAPEHLPRLTERFYRVDKGRSRRLGGTGLGLAIVKHIVRRHQGQLEIDSELGRGSRFCVWLPAEGEG